MKLKKKIKKLLDVDYGNILISVGIISLLGTFSLYLYDINMYFGIMGAGVIIAIFGYLISDEDKK